MYTFNIDMQKKIVYIELSGRFNLEETEKFVQELHNLFSSFGPKEISTLWILNKLDPFPQNCLPLLINSMCDNLIYVRKATSFHSRMVTQMQMKRIEAAVNNILGEQLPIKRFKSNKEAIEFLYKD